jgi:hypothetical protein
MPDQGEESVYEKTDKNTLVNSGIEGLKKAIEAFEGEQIDAAGLVAGATNIWNNLNSNSEIKVKIEEEMRDRRMALHQMAAIDISRNGDPVRRRYDPSMWMQSIPEYMKDHPKEFAVDRCKSLLNLLEGALV